MEKQLSPHNQDEWDRSQCPYCGRSFPHKKEEKPATCGKVRCLQEAVWWERHKGKTDKEER